MSTELELQESVARLKAAEDAGTAPPPAKYYWWAWLKALTGLLYVASLLITHEGSQLRVYEGLTEDGRRTLWICAYDAGGHWLGGFNQGFGCPPFCG